MAEMRTPAPELEAFVREYIRLWNARDAEAIWSRVYRLGPEGHVHSADEVKAWIAELSAQGFSHTDLHSVSASYVGPDEGAAEIRFTRVLNDGSVMGLPNRGARYRLIRFDDGWRIVQMAPIPDDPG